MEALMLIWRLGVWMHSKRYLRFLSVVPQIAFRLVTGAHLPVSITCGKNLSLAYGGSGLVVHKRTKIGSNVLLSPGVVLGGRSGQEPPTIEDNVQIMAGAKILGALRVGSGSFIGANAVILHDVPPNSVWVSVKAIRIK